MWDLIVSVPNQGLSFYFDTNWSRIPTKKSIKSEPGPEHDGQIQTWTRTQN